MFMGNLTRHEEGGRSASSARDRPLSLLYSNVDDPARGRVRVAQLEKRGPWTLSW